MLRKRLPLICFGSLLASFLCLAQQSPVTNTIGLGPNGEPILSLPLEPGIEEFTILSTPDLTQPFATNTQGQLYGYTWTGAKPAGKSEFYNIQLTPLSSNAVLTATVLNRLAYGPTPDELARVLQMGPQAFIDEQMAPELIHEWLPVDEVKEISEGWTFVSVSGPASSSRVYISIDQEGHMFIDDLKVVRGTSPDAGPNLLKQGDFELPLDTNVWVFGEDFTGSHVSTEKARSGASSLKLVASDDGGGGANSLNQIITPALVNNATYNISYWYWRDTNVQQRLTIRLSGSGIVAENTAEYTPATMLAHGLGTATHLQQWHTTHAIESKRQLLETLLQFWDNHFVTQYDKSVEYFDQYYGGNFDSRLAALIEYREIQKWREALLRPGCTFHDLLKISAESPAMIIYLDTVNSKGNGSNVANENYARELLELFTFGVDNGYDQNDIVTMSRAWTGWSVNIVDATNYNNPFAARTTVRLPGAPDGAIANLKGVWTFNFKSANHNTAAKLIFPGKTVPARFGAPYAGRSYELSIPARTGTNGIVDGYQVLQHLADQPFTQEYISVKLCRLFVHDHFEHGYDFTDPNLSAEGKLVRECMRAWENGSPKGQIRDVLRVIFNSEMFRTQAASMQKVKTPFEFVVSAVRALRAQKADGTYTAQSVGNLRDAMTRMGDMQLFNRPEPDGYPETAAAWISAGTLAERLRFVQGLVSTEATVRDNAGSSNSADPVALIQLRLPQSEWGNAEAISRYFLSVLYPAEGRANLDLYRRAAVKYLNTADNGTASPFSSLTLNSAGYQSRVRGMVAMLMTFPRFQEQ
ncbi:MAG TPA: DUF1800 family protein [Methylomirabilota bacterium]|nr:DUF1800 family protein [Methylomirabilota bacterium]